jgi:predicted PurR-regulated permease PerM
MAGSVRPLSKAPLHQVGSEARQGPSPRLADTGEVKKPSAPISSALEEAEILHASLKAGSVAQIVVALIAVIGLLYLLKFVMVTTLVALLLAFILEPLVESLHRGGVPRGLGSLLTVVLVALFITISCYFLFGRAREFASELPKYSERIRSSLRQFQEPMNKLEMSTRSVMSSSSKDGRQPVPVEIQQEPVFRRVIFDGGSAVKDLFLAIGFIPFLTYFMLTCKEHAHSATVRLFPKEHRLTAYRTVATISAMIRSFLIGNLVVGVISAIACGTVFWLVGIPYFYFLGAISGFFGLIPSIGVFLSLLPPLVGGLGVLHKAGVGAILTTIVGIHAVMMNFVYPKLMGKRLRLNPLAVVLSLLFWAWIWGAMGLIFAVPIIAATKITCDYTDSLKGLGAWLGNEELGVNAVDQMV